MWNIDLSAVSDAVASASATVDQFANSALNLDNLQEADDGQGARKVGKEGHAVEWREDYDEHRKPKRMESPIQHAQQAKELPREEGKVASIPSPSQNVSPRTPKSKDKATKSSKKPAASKAESRKNSSSSNPLVVDDSGNAKEEEEVKNGVIVESPLAAGKDDHNKALESKLISLEREKEALMQQVTNLEKVASDMGAKDRKKSMEVEEMKMAKAALASDLAKLSEEAKQKDDTVTDLREKLKGLTDKTREVMKSYSQSKERVKALEKSEEIAKSAKGTISTKDAEILSLKLKLENVERIVAEQKDAAASSAEQKQKTKKERSADQETISKLTERVGVLEGELTKATTATAGLAEEASRAQGQYEREKGALAALKLELEEAKRKFKEDLKTTESTHATVVSERESELENLRMKLGSENEASTQHEEYKKRAQIALKKANSSASEMNAQITELQRAIKSNESELLTLRETLVKEEAARKAAEGLAESQGAERVAMAEELEKARKVAELSNEEAAQLQGANTALSEACEQLEAAVSAKSKLIEEKTIELARAQAAVKDAQDQKSALERMHANAAPGEHLAVPTNGKGTKPSADVSNAQRAAADTYPQENPPSAGGDTDSIPNQSASPDQLYYVQTLSTELEQLKRENGEKSMEISEAKMEMARHAEESKNLQGRIEELQNFLNRSKKSTDSEAVTNMEYLKNCVCRFMTTTEMSEKKRLFPVISTILNFTTSERQQIILALNDMEAGATIDIAASISHSVTSLFE
jgi:predicted  nucleic acid-binding Zn-ribbon protein